MKALKIAVVIPTIRDLDFLKEWVSEFKNCYGIIIEDRAEKKIVSPKKYFKKLFHYSWQEIDRELGDRSWIIPRRNAGIRNYGFLKAYELGADITITLDDDCFPIKGQNFLQSHLDNLSLSAPDDWFPTYPHRKFYPTRGFPYDIRNKKEVVMSHGLWSNILDFDAKTHLKYEDVHMPAISSDLLEFIPKDYFFPMCSMNLAFKTKITPIMFFPPMGYDNKGDHWGYDRFDDIWAGIFAKKVIDHLGYAVVNGSPFVEHKKASNVNENLKKEAKGIKIEAGVKFKNLSKRREEP
jgi:reversibly glycosylated polypeptide/UDP-arabinopyranose mutase